MPEFLVKFCKSVPARNRLAAWHKALELAEAGDMTVLSVSYEPVPDIKLPAGLLEKGKGK